MVSKEKYIQQIDKIIKHNSKLAEYLAKAEDCHIEAVVENILLELKLDRIRRTSWYKLGKFLRVI